MNPMRSGREEQDRSADFQVAVDRSATMLEEVVEVAVECKLETVSDRSHHASQVLAMDNLQHSRRCRWGMRQQHMGP